MASRTPHAATSPTSGSHEGKGRARDSGYGESGTDDDESAPVAIEDEPQVWEVMWREPQTRKNKSWNDDGTLVIKGNVATLRSDEGKTLGTSTTISTPLIFEQELKIGGKDVQIQDPLPYASYLRKFPLPTTSTTSSSTSSHPPPPPSRVPSISRGPKTCIPPAVTPTAILARPFKKFKGLVPMNRSDSVDRERELREKAEKAERERKKREDEERRVAREKKENEAMVVDEELVSSQGVDEEYGEGEEGSGEEEVEVPRSSQKRGAVQGEVAKGSSQEGKGAGSSESKMEVDEEVVIVEVKDKGKEKAVEVVKPKGGLVPRPKPWDNLRLSQAQDDTPPESHYYLCHWRKHSTKKHKVWEGDGVLIVCGRKATLSDRDTGKEIAKASTTGARFNPGDEVSVGSKEIEIESILDEADYVNGKVFIKNGVKVHAPDTFFIPAVIRPPPKEVAANFKDPSLAPHVPKPKGALPKFDPFAEGAVVMRRPDAQHSATYNKKGFPIVDVVLDPIIATSLRPHQVEGVKFMYECVMGMKSEGQGCILADEMGLGKTIQAITLIYTLLNQSPYHKGASSGVIERAMIACPVTLVKNWAAEIKKWLGRDRLRVFVADGKNEVQRFASTKHFQVLIIGYEKLRTVIDVVKAAQPPIGLIICDEGHRLKSSSSQLSKALKTLTTPRRVILSGTPIQNDLSEFHSMVDFVNPGVLDVYATFKKVFESVILKSREPKANPKDKRLGQARADQLSRVSKAYILRRTGEVIQQYLPPKLEYTVFIIPTELEIKLYSTILEGSAVKDLLSGAAQQQLSLLMVLRQLSNSPGLLMRQAKAGKCADILTDNVTDHFPAGADPDDFALSGKFLAVGSLLANLFAGGEEKIVVVSNFTSTLDIIEKHCERKKYPMCRLDGKTPQADRIAMVEGYNKGFRKSNFVFLLSSKSGGTGLNIIGASRLVLIDSDWNPSTDLQAMARIHRQGQQRQCVIYRFLSTGTMDEKIFQRQVTKLGLSNSLMDENTEIGGDKGDAFTLDDLKKVFQLHTGVGCQTHDLLGCRCHLDENPEDGEAPDSDDDQDLPSFNEVLKRSGFKAASQWQSSEEPAKKDRKNLSVLKSWIHHDCRVDTSADEIEDAVLRRLVYERVAEAPHEKGTPAPGGWDLKGGMIGFAFAKKTG